MMIWRAQWPFTKKTKTLNFKSNYSTTLWVQSPGKMAWNSFKLNFEPRISRKLNILCNYNPRNHENAGLSFIFPIWDFTSILNISFIQCFWLHNFSLVLQIVSDIYKRDSLHQKSHFSEGWGEGKVYIKTCTFMSQELYS